MTARLLLVLLIVLLSGARLSQEGLDVYLPFETDHDEPETQIVLEYSADRRITVNSEDISPSELGVTLRRIYRARRNKTMWLSADGSLRYGDVMDVIAAAKGAGVGQVGVITPGMRQR